MSLSSRPGARSRVVCRLASPPQLTAISGSTYWLAPSPVRPRVELTLLASSQPHPARSRLGRRLGIAADLIAIIGIRWPWEEGKQEARASERELRKQGLQKTVSARLTSPLCIRTHIVTIHLQCPASAQPIDNTNADAAQQDSAWCRDGLSIGLDFRCGKTLITVTHIPLEH